MCLMFKLVPGSLKSILIISSSCCWGTKKPEILRLVSGMPSGSVAISSGSQAFILESIELREDILLTKNDSKRDDDFVSHFAPTVPRSTKPIGSPTFRLQFQSKAIPILEIPSRRSPMHAACQATTSCISKEKIGRNASNHAASRLGGDGNHHLFPRQGRENVGQHMREKTVRYAIQLSYNSAVVLPWPRMPSYPWLWHSQCLILAFFFWGQILKLCPDL
jgi:hypothetical protein